MRNRSNRWSTSRGIALTLALGWAAIAPASAQQVNADWDKTANFAGFKTYSALKGNVPAGANPLMVQRVQSAIEAELSAIGLLKVDKDPDLFVAVHGATKEETSLQGYSYGYAPRFGGGGGTINVNKILTGMLIVDIADARTKQLVFRGTASDTISDNPQKNEKKIHKAVEKIFEKYPGNTPK